MQLSSNKFVVKYTTRTIFSAMLFMLSHLCHAQILSTHLTYDDEIKKARNFTALDDSLFGDKINLQDGSLSFNQNDILIPTNSQLNLSFGRKKQLNPRRDITFDILGWGWEPDIPYMMGTYDTRDGWNGGTTDGRRCSTGTLSPNFKMGPYPYYYTQPIFPYMYWHGTNINIPGSGEELLLKKNIAQSLPTDGKSYVGTTKSGWRISCLGSIKNGAGEGFAVTTTDGVTYYFDWLAIRNAPDLVGGGVPIDAYGESTDPWHTLAPLSDVFLYATKAVDRFGNVVTYTYDQVKPNRITSITSNDGAQLNISYNANGLVSTVASSNRTWSYTYIDSGLGFNELSSVTLPDNTKWFYEFQKATTRVTSDFWGDACKQDPGGLRGDTIPASGQLYSYVMTHPSGARGQFKMRGVYHGTNNTPGGCTRFGSVQTSFWYGTYGVPSAYIAQSLYQKSITGNAISGKIWTYYYYPTWSFSSQCTASCASTSQTTVETTDGVRRRYTFGNNYSSNMGQLLSETVEKNAVIHRTTNNNYLTTTAGQSFPNNAGDVPTGYMPSTNIGIIEQHGNPFLYLNRPMSSSTTTQDGVNFTHTTNAFETFVRPTSITKSSSLGSTRTDTIAYENNLSKWVLGQVKTVTNTNTGKVVSDTTYNANALPIASSSFGLPQGSTTYNADSTIASMKDAKNNTFTLSNYKRGVPQNVGFADGTGISAVVNDSGWITSVADQLGSTTSYEYDLMGRLRKTLYPVGDTNAWQPTNTWFRQQANGVWANSVWDDRYAKATEFDALWRPILQTEWDWADGPGTQRQTSWRYDSQGRMIFQSYPYKTTTDVNTLPGITTEYDALGRVTKVKQDSELGQLTTTTEYLAGFQTKVTNPKGVVTRQGYQVFDAPDTSRPVFTVYAEGTAESKISDVNRDVFGKVLYTQMRNPSASQYLGRSYVFDANERLCKTVVPEQGATHYEYDANNNVIRMAEGDHTNTSRACDAGNIALTDKTVNTYDVMNRITNIDVPGGNNGDKSYIYAGDGLVTQINTVSNTAPIVNRYFYNKRRLLTNEHSEQTGWYTWGMAYAYNDNAALSRISYPTGFYVDYAPNGLGQATQAASVHGNWANTISYYPNGAVKQFTYGNGMVHNMYQNARQLPGASIDSKAGAANVLEQHILYDANGNVTTLGDPANAERNWRSMDYDALDRLTHTNSPNNFGHAYYQYDALDNLKRSTLGLAGFTYNYDANNRLSRVDRDAGGSYTYAYDGKGNVTNNGRNAFTYDGANRMYDAAGVEGYRYDGNNRRVLAWAPVGGGIISLYGQDGTLYYQHNDRETQNYEYIYLNGDPIAFRNYNWANGTANATLKTRFQHTDALGSPVATTDEAGNVVDRTEYAPYGAPLNRPVSGVGYTGHVMDQNTGLVYAQQRYYDPMLGRFLSPDPVQTDPNNGASFNRFAYANNNPYLFTDPDGRMSRKELDEQKERSRLASQNKITARDVSDAILRRVVGGVALNENKRTNSPTKISQKEAAQLYGTNDKITVAAVGAVALTPVALTTVEATTVIYSEAQILAFRVVSSPGGQRVIAAGCFAIGCANGEPGKGGGQFVRDITNRATTREGIVSELSRRLSYLTPAD